MGTTVVQNSLINETLKALGVTPGGPSTLGRDVGNGLSTLVNLINSFKDPREKKIEYQPSQGYTPALEASLRTELDKLAKLEVDLPGFIGKTKVVETLKDDSYIGMPRRTALSTTMKLLPLPQALKDDPSKFVRLVEQKDDIFTALGQLRTDGVLKVQAAPAAGASAPPPAGKTAPVAPAVKPSPAAAPALPAAAPAQQPSTASPPVPSTAAPSTAAAPPPAPVTGPGGMTVAQATQIAEQSLVNVIKLVQPLSSTKFTAPGAVGGEFDQQSVVASYEVLDSLTKLLKIENPGGEYTPALGKRIRDTLSLPENSLYKSMIVKADGTGAFKSDAEVDSMIQAFDTLHANGKLGKRPASVAAKPPTLSQGQTDLEKWAFNNPAFVSMLDEMLRLFTGYGFKELFPGVNIPGLDRAGKPELPADPKQRLEALFKETFDGSKPFAQVRADLVSRTEAILQLSFGDADRRRLMRDMINTGLNQAGEALAAGKSKDDAAKLFADVIASRMAQLNSQHPAIHTPNYAVNGKPYTIAQNVYFGTDLPMRRAKPEDPAGVADVYDSPRAGRDRHPMAFTDARTGTAHVVLVESGTNLMFVRKFTKDEIAAIQADITKANIPRLDSVTDPKDGALIIRKSEELHAQLMQKYEGYRLVMNNHGLASLGGPENFVKNLSTAPPLDSLRTKARQEAERAVREAQESPAALAAASAARERGAAAVQVSNTRSTGTNNLPPTAAQWSGKPLDRAALQHQSGLWGLEIKVRSEENVNERALNAGTNVYRSSNGHALVEYRDKAGQSHTIDMSAHLNYFRSFADKPDREILVEDMHLQKMPDVTSRQYLDYVMRYAEKHNVDVNGRLAQLSPPMTDLRRSYPFVRDEMALLNGIADRYRAVNLYKDVKPASSAADGKGIEVYADARGQVLVRYFDKGSNQVRIADVTAQLAYYNGYSKEQLLGWKRTPAVAQEDYVDFVRAFSKKKNIDLEDEFAKFSSSSQHWLGTILKNHPGAANDIAGLAAQIEDEHMKLAGSHNHYGGLTGTWDRHKGEVHKADSPTTVESCGPNGHCTVEIPDEPVVVATPVNYRQLTGEMPAGCVDGSGSCTVQFPENDIDTGTPVPGAIVAPRTPTAPASAPRR